MKTAEPCPCGGKRYVDCCGRYHGGIPAPSPETLMRSRYSAFALGLEDYLLASWHPDTRPAELDVHTPPQPKWIGLQVLEARMQDATHGTVHFVARCRIGGKAHRQEENSRFVCEEGRWYYLDGVEAESGS
jgi:SEC-C motif-containing protein